MRKWTRRCFVTSRTAQMCAMRWCVFFVLFFNFYWSIVDLQCCVRFRCMAKWVSMKWSFKKTLCPFGCLSFGSFVCALTSCHQPVPTLRPQLCVYKSSLSSPPPSWGPEPVCLWWRKYPGLLNLALTLFFLPLCSMWDLSSLPRDWTQAPCIGGRLNHWTIREVSLL